jgi:hypothetical protein
MSFTSNSTSINKLGAAFQGNIVKAGKQNEERSRRLDTDGNFGTIGKLKQKQNMSVW